MESKAAASGAPQATIKSQSAACISLLATNGYDLNQGVDPVFISRLAQAIAGKDLVQVPGLVLLDIGFALDDAIRDLLR